jgi:hypothetical protein
MVGSPYVPSGEAFTNRVLTTAFYANGFDVAVMRGTPAVAPSPSLPVLKIPEASRDVLLPMPTMGTVASEECREMRLTGVRKNLLIAQALLVKERGIGSSDNMSFGLTFGQ